MRMRNRTESARIREHICELEKQGYSHRRIACLIGCSVNTVYYHTIVRERRLSGEKNKPWKPSNKGKRFKYKVLCGEHTVVDYKPDDVNYIREMANGEMLYFQKILGYFKTMQEAKKCVKRLNAEVALGRLK